MALEVKVVRGRCIGTKACVNAAPRVFAIDATNVSTVVDPAGDPDDDVILAAQSCPTGAISVWRGTEQVV